MLFWHLLWMLTILFELFVKQVDVNLFDKQQQYIFKINLADWILRIIFFLLILESFFFCSNKNSFLENQDLELIYVIFTLFVTWEVLKYLCFCFLIFMKRIYVSFYILSNMSNFWKYYNDFLKNFSELWDCFEAFSILCKTFFRFLLVLVFLSRWTALWNLN